MENKLSVYINIKSFTFYIFCVKVLLAYYLGLTVVFGINLQAVTCLGAQY